MRFNIIAKTAALYATTFFILGIQPSVADLTPRASGRALESVSRGPPSDFNISTLLGRDASTELSGGTNNEGEDHDALDIPSGAKLKRLHFSSGESLVSYWPKSVNEAKATHAYVMIHGRLRDGNNYWQVMNDALQSAIDDDYPGVDKNAIVAAPQFFSTRYNKGQYKSKDLAWGDVNAWQAGEKATHPKGSDVDSFDALDKYIDEFSNGNKYPSMKNVTIVGHGGGGQLAARYAVVAQSAPSGIHIRYIMGDPSSQPYFTTDRPTPSSSWKATKKSCPMYNQWRYGFDDFGSASMSPQSYFQQYVQRDVVSIIGYQDTDASGDEYCMAQLQGGSKRRNRNMCWWQYINLLAGTNEDLSGYPCSFKDLPDWSVDNFNIRLSIVKSADHDAAQVFGSSQGRSVLFAKYKVAQGYRPAKKRHHHHKKHKKHRKHKKEDRDIEEKEEERDIEDEDEVEERDLEETELEERDLDDDDNWEWQEE